MAFRVIAANRAPDHTTIARFRQRHEAALAGLFGEVFELCAEAGLVEVGVVAVDGTKLHADASKDANTGYEQIAREILAEADAVDREEDERYGEGERADVLPPGFRTSHGRRGWIREAKRRLEERRAEEARAIPGSRPERLRECERRLEEDLGVECRAVERQDEVWAARVAAGKQPRSRPPRPYRRPEAPPGEINVSDPDSRRLKGPRGYLQGYNAHAAVTERRIVIAAEVNADAPDFGHLETMVTAAQGELERGRRQRHAGCRGRQRRLLEPGAHGGDGGPRIQVIVRARRGQLTRPPARLGGRSLRVHAPRAPDRAAAGSTASARR